MTTFKTLLKPANRWFEENKTQLLRYAIISSVLMFCAFMVPHATIGNRLPGLLVLLLIGSLLLIILMRWLILGVIFVIFAGAFVPISGLSGFNASIIGIGLALVLWLLDMIVRQKKLKIVPSRTFLPLFVFMIVSILAFIIGQIPWFVFARQAPLTAQLGGFTIFFLSLGAFLLVANIVKDLRSLQLLTWIFIGIGGFYVIGRFLDLGVIDRIYHIGFTAGALFWTWLAALAFAQALFNRSLRVPLRLLLIGIVVLTFYVAIVQAYDWKSGWVPPLAAVAAILAIRYWRLALILSPLALIPAFILINRTIGSDEYSWGTRLDAWAIVVQIAKADPILGLGFANYYWYTPLFPIRGYAVVFNSHSQFVDLIAETGLLGLGSFLWLFLQTFYLGWSLRDRAPDGFAKAYVYAVIGGVAGTLAAAGLVDWVLPFVYNIGLTGFRASILAWIFMGGLVAVEQIVRRNSQLV